MDHLIGEESWRHSRQRSPLLILAISFVIAAGACARSQPGNQVLLSQRIYLAENLDHSHRAKADQEFPRLDNFDLGFDRRLSIRQEVPSALTFSPIPSGGDQSLVLSLALQNRRATTSTGATTAVVVCRKRGREVELIREHLSPVAEGDNPQWLERVIPLKACPGPFASRVHRRGRSSGR